MLADTEILFAPLGFLVDSDRLDRCPKLRALASNTTGIQHIDVVAATTRSITIYALHDDGDFLDKITPTAEHAVGLMLAAWRRIPAAHNAAFNGAWDRRPWGAPAMFSRLRLGLVGYGRLGRRVAKIGRAFDMDVAYFDPNVPGGMDSLIELARRSDILSLHAIASEETRGLVDREVLSALPRGAMVVNTARGEILDADALIDLLESEHIQCAALDAVDGEYAPGFQDNFGNSRLARYAREHDNLILTPHIGGSTVDAWHDTERRVIDKVCIALSMEIEP